MANEVRCRYCRGKVQVRVNHFCRAMHNAGKHSAQQANEDNGDFFVSLAVAAATDNWILGAAVGRSVSGALVGGLARGGSSGDDGGDDNDDD